MSACCISQQQRQMKDGSPHALAETASSFAKNPFPAAQQHICVPGIARFLPHPRTAEQVFASAPQLGL
jgi:hypothetical protein